MSKLYTVTTNRCDVFVPVGSTVYVIRIRFTKGGHMSKGRATATFVVTEEVVEGELFVSIVAPASVDTRSRKGTYTGNSVR